MVKESAREIMKHGERRLNRPVYSVGSKKICCAVFQQPGGPYPREFCILVFLHAAIIICVACAYVTPRGALRCCPSATKLSNNYYVCIFCTATLRAKNARGASAVCNPSATQQSLHAAAVTANTCAVRNPSATL
jgi:hypothetical protein